MNRRELLTALVGASGAFLGSRWIHLPDAAAAPSTTAATDQKISLQEHAAARGLLFGAALRKKHLCDDQPYANLASQQCGILVPELELKWDMLRPTPDQYDFSGGDWLYEFATSHRMLFRGHTLVWEGALPGWFTTTVTA